ncbi:MAG TPA: hypothetical protein DCE41_25595 [Cytophagales bacterium]|nr:hypothetical protein [Cytophagales bacterium]HAA19914.1 hypothetical protein [Cytophagales bacterium]HAP62659.1 hypothetical protein [Cytophagales bacterium]
MEDTSLSLKNSNNQTTVSLDGRTGSGSFGTSGSSGEIYIKNSSGRNTIIFYGSQGTAHFGTSGQDGELYVKDSNNRSVISADGNTGSLKVGSTGRNGDLKIIDSKNDTRIHLKGEHGIMSFLDDRGRPTLEIGSRYGNIYLGGNGQDGDVQVKNEAGTVTAHLDGHGGSLILGGTGVNGDIKMKDNTNTETIRILGANGDIEFMNADLAEEFELQESIVEDVEAGTVMIMNDQGQILPCDTVYDGRVVGVISGAGSYKPALVLDKKAGNNRQPIAMVGKVYCKVDASVAPIRVGDLLTTSATPGHAMKATDRDRAFGTVIGKAMGIASVGQSMIPVLVNLQ